MSGNAENRFCFITEWHDTQADMIRRYMLTFFPRDNSLEMYDPKNRRPFLKRSEYADIKSEQLYIGATVTVHARQLKITDYADTYTKKAFEEAKGRTLAMIKPDAYNNIGNILSTITNSAVAGEPGSGLVVSNLKMVRMDAEKATAFVNMQESPMAMGQDHAAHLSSDVCVVMELVGKDAVGVWKAMMGPESAAEAKATAARSIRGAIATDDVRNAVGGSSSDEQAAKDIAFFFGKDFKTTALFNNCTLCVVRPHAFVESGGAIVSQILQEGIEISAMNLFYLDKADAEEFLEVYKGVLPEYHDMVTALCAGACLVMEVRQKDAVATFRKLVGPHDPEVAKHLRPKTLRAEFGKDRVKNAVHCTDLPEDGLLEVEYFFNILQSKPKVM